MGRCAYLLCLLATTSCANAAVIPTAPAAPLPDRAPAGSALVFFVLGDAADPVPRFGGLPRAWPAGRSSRGVDVLDERGELLGRLRANSWLAVERPPGPQTFYAVPTDWFSICLEGRCPDADARVGLLRANLGADEIYAVWLGAELERSTMEGAPECRRAYLDTDIHTSGLTQATWSLGLLAVSGAAWSTVNDLFHDERTVAVPVAPRGLRHPSAEEAISGARARVGRCWSEMRSTIGPEAGLAERPRAAPLRPRGRSSAPW